MAAIPQHAPDPGFGLKISPAAILRSLLQQYPSGGQFFSEALQNADDTGRATKFCAMLDMRKHGTTRLREPVANRATLQGEAIVFYDDAGFSERDWRSLQFMCDSQKRHTVHEAGAFGMGSRSFFHITDVLQVLSHSKLSALDPDELLETGHFGEQIDFVDQDLMRTSADEASVFHGLFGCDMKADFPGTLIRASLRSAERAKSCSFCPHRFDISRAERIFQEFEEALANGEVILFLTCVQQVELWHWDNGAPEPTLLARTKLGVSSGHDVPKELHSPIEARTYLEKFKNEQEPFAALKADLMKPETKPPIILDVVDMETEFASTGQKVRSRRWLRFGSFSKDPETVRLGAACSSVPMVTLALPICGEAAEGRVFTLLPLPLLTGLPCHLNASFRLHDNRRALWRLTKDLEGQHRLWADWNERVLTDFVPQVYAEALTWLNQHSELATGHGHCAWPVESSTERDFLTILGPLVQQLQKRQSLRATDLSLVTPPEALYFNSPTDALVACRADLLQHCIQAGHKVVDPAKHVVDFLHNRKALTVKDITWVLYDILVPAEGRIEKAKLALLLVPFLELCSSWNETEIGNLGKRLAHIEWVPCNDGKTRKVADCFDPAKSPGELGVVEQRRAKLEEVFSQAQVKPADVWHVLKICGIKQEIHWEDAVDESKQIIEAQDLARADRLFSHLNRCHSWMRGERKKALEVLSTIPWVPSMEPEQEPTEAATAGSSKLKLLSLQQIFPTAARPVVWAVAPTLFTTAAASVKELKPARSVHSEAKTIVDQLIALPKLVTDAKRCLTHSRTAFDALPRERIVAEVVLPTATALKAQSEPKRLPTLLLSFLEWASSWTDPHLKELSKQLSSLAWLPVEEGAPRTISDTFDPEIAPTAFRVVQSGRTKIATFIEEIGLDSKQLWRSLRLCGSKADLNWEDAASEAESIAKEKDLSRASALFAHLDKRMAQLRGSKSVALQKLQEIAWVPATQPATKPDKPSGDVGLTAQQLLKLKEVCLPSSYPEIWAVAPCLALAKDPTSLELQPGRRVAAEPATLGKQLAQLATWAVSKDSGKGDILAAVELPPHMAAVFNALPKARTLPEVILPIVADLKGEVLTVCLLVFLHWANAWSDAEIRDLGRKMAAVTFLPVEDGTVRCIPDAFDPNNSPAIFHVVRERKAKIDSFISLVNLDATALWRVLNLCELKREISWENAVEEAKAIINDKDLKRAEQLYSHLNMNRERLSGKRSAVMPKLQSLPWIPATDPEAHKKGLPASAEVTEQALEAKQLLALKDLFPKAQHRFVWAVAPALVTSSDANFHELKPLRDVEKETNVLVEQINHLVTCDLPPKVVLDHYKALFTALPHSRLMSEVLLPATSRIDGRHLTAFLLTFLEWASSWKDSELQEVGRKLATTQWLPTKEGEVSTLSECFYPSKDLLQFSVVAKRSVDTATIEGHARASAKTEGKEGDSAIEKSVEVLWRTLKLCGLKQELAWKDVVEEAETVSSSNNFEVAQALFEHVNAKHRDVTGDRTTALQKLQDIAWIVSHTATTTPPPLSAAPPTTAVNGNNSNNTTTATTTTNGNGQNGNGKSNGAAAAKLQLLKLKEIFAASSREVVWAVAPCMASEKEPSIHELKPGRAIETEPLVLVSQVKSLCTMPSGVVTLAHFKVVLGALKVGRTFPEVVLPVLMDLEGKDLGPFMMAFTEWAATACKESEVKDMGPKLSKCAWLPVEEGGLRPIAQAFDPKDSPEAFQIVLARRAALEPLLKATGAKEESVWKVLRLCGLKQQLTWEETVEEAEMVVKEKDLVRAEKLFLYIDKHHPKLSGDRTSSIAKLKTVPWVPARAQSSEGDEDPTLELREIGALFPAKQRGLVWAVAASLAIEVEPSLYELKPGRNIEKETQILVDQVSELAQKPLKSGTLDHLRACFGALSRSRVLKEVIQPSCEKLSGKSLTGLLLSFLEWASSWKETEIRELGRQIESLAWVPVEDGSTKPLAACFDPEASPGQFSVVTSNRANFTDVLTEADLRPDGIWRSLRLCGLKVELTWADALDEAKDLAAKNDFARARALITHLSHSHARLAGDRSAGLKALQEFAWLPATAPTKTAPAAEPAALTAQKFETAKALFPASEYKCVWAVASCLVVELEGTNILPELKAGCSVSLATKVLIEQVVALTTAKAGTTFAENVSYLHDVFVALRPPRLVSDVILKALEQLDEEQQTLLLLCLCDWAANLKETEIKEVGTQLASTTWLPVEDGTRQSLSVCFDPVESPADFAVVQKRRIKITTLVKKAGVKEESVLKVLRICGIKKEVSWADAIEEAESAMTTNDLHRAAKLFSHIDKAHAQMTGERKTALDKLKGLAWVPSIAASKEGVKQSGPTGFAALKDLFPPAEHKLIWAVAPALCVDITPTLHELLPGRSVQKEPEVLVEQVRVLADKAAAESGQVPPCITLEELEHFREAFQALAPLASKLPTSNLSDHPRLKGVAFMPCMPVSEDYGAALFKPACTTCSAQHSHRSLSPAIGIVKPMDNIIKHLAEACGVPKEPSARVLAEALCNIPEGKIDLAVTLAAELAGRIREKELKPACIMVPTTADTVEKVERVFIDDAPWQQGNILRLHPRISADDGKLLGCSSVRAELIRQCEEDGIGLESASTDLSRNNSLSLDVNDGDAFGQEADLVSQVMQLLQEYGDSADLVKEFVQNADDAGAESLAFFIQDENHGSERIVDPRTAPLQGPALYICCDNALTSEDIVRMQNVGRSKKRLDFSSSGRFGVGMNVMYRYCDCPQLLANQRLHFFDLTRGYVSAPGMSRGRKFTIDKLKANFPDSYAPFEHSMASNFPTIFRLALRTERSELGLKQDFEKVLAELSDSASIADKMLLFTKNLSRLEFYKGEDLITAVDTKIQKQAEFNKFFDQIPSSPLDLKLGNILSHRATKIITVTKPGEESVAEWAIAHRVGLTDAKMLEVLKEQLERPFGVALYPHGACAARVKPFDKEHRTGRICVGLPTPFKTNSSAWIHGGFALLSSRKSLPLPDDIEKEPSLDKSWNKMLLTGVIAGAMHELISHCCSQVVFSGMKLDEFFSMFPLRGDRLQTMLAAATFKASLKSAVFPVFRGSSGKVSWAAGPKPVFACEELTESLQEALVEDGLKLASLPPALMLEYEDALGEPRRRLGGLELCQFLREAWQERHGGTKKNEVTGDGAKAESTEEGVTDDEVPEFELGECGLLGLRDRDDIVTMMRFVANALWEEHLTKKGKSWAMKQGWQLHKFDLLDGLDSVPLLLTHANKITIFTPKHTKYNSWRDILPTRANMFVNKDIHKAIVNAVDTTIEGINREVKTEVPGVRAFTLHDLIPHREEFEALIDPKSSFCSPRNEVLRQFWSLVADSVLIDRTPVDVTPGAPAPPPTGTAMVEIGGKKVPWQKAIEDWPVLPILDGEAEGENGEGCLTLLSAGNVVAVNLVTQDAEVANSLSGILKQCGVPVLQPEVLADERIARMVQPLLVTTNMGMLKLLCEGPADVEALSGAQRHELLAYFSVLLVRGNIDLSMVAKLPLFKTADPKSPKFVALKPDVVHCCVDPTDKHSNALCKLTPPRMVLLAWPTAQGKPIFEYCDIKLCTGEEFMINYIIPELPGICAKDPDGMQSYPYLRELHAYVCIDNSDRVKQAASECDFVPSAEDKTKTALASTYVSIAGGAAKLFSSVLTSYLPALWLQKNKWHMELLSKLGMSTHLSSTMILICAKHLHKAFTGEAEINLSKEVEAAVSGQKRKSADEETPATLEMMGCEGEPLLNGTYNLTEEFAEYLGHSKPVYKMENAGQTYFAYFWKDNDSPEATGWYIATEVGSEDILAVNKSAQDSELPPGPSDWEVVSGASATHKLELGCGFLAPTNEKKRKVAEEDDEAKETLATKEQVQSKNVGGGKVERKLPTGVVTDSLRLMSFELLEEWARASEEVWPKPGAVRSALHDPSQRDKLHDMWNLLESASLKILVARRHDCIETRKKEVEGRNAQRLDGKNAADKAAELPLKESTVLELVPLKGVAFKKAQQVLWSVAPVADHQSPNQTKTTTTHLNSLVTNHAEGMFNVFGSWVKAKHAPPELVMQHLTYLCNLPEAEPGIVAIKPGSVLHEDLKGCWSYFSDSLYTLEEPEVKVHLGVLQTLPCIAVHSEDVADRPVEEVLMTLPKFAFFQLPLLRGKEANLRLYMRQVKTDGPREAAVFRAFGAMERASAVDYASASERVAKRASKLGGRGSWEWVVACLEACVRGFHEDVLHKKTEGIEVKVENLHMFSKEGKPENVKALVWADVPRWLNRCNESGGALKIANLKGEDQRDIAQTLVDCAGLRELSTLVEERRIQDDEGRQGKVFALEANSQEEDPASKRFKWRIQQLLQSFEFASGLCAVIRHSQSQNQQVANTPAEVRRELRKIQFKVAVRALRSALFWKPKEKLRHEHPLVRSEPGAGWVCNGCNNDGSSDKELIRYRCKAGSNFNLCIDCYTETQKVIPGSERMQQIYYDEGEKSVYIQGKDHKHSNKEIEDLSSEMVFALRRALPLLYQVESFLLEAMISCGLRDGAAGLQSFLEKRDIKVVGLAAQEDHLGPGQRLPEELEGKLTWNMEASFGEGETAAVLINDVFTIVEVASWPLGKEPPKGSGLSRSYRVRVSGAMDESAYKTIKHFELYKIPLDEAAEAVPESTAIEVAGEAREVVEEKTDNEEDEKKVADAKKYLKEMSGMEPDEYKVVMRRLFKTWHPDRAGDTPVSNRIFRMLRSHEQWYKKKQNGESVGEWDDDEGDKGTTVVPEDGIKALPAPDAEEYVPADGGQSSWFDEFESEMRTKKDVGPQAKVMARPPEKPSFGPSEEPDNFDEEKDGEEKKDPEAVAAAAPRDAELEEQLLAGPTRIVDRRQAPIWLQQARLEMIAARKLAEVFDNYRSLPASAVWHSEQVVEMAIKAAMLRTCGISEDESIGGSAHDIAEFVRRLKSADAQTAEQRLAQQVPVNDADIIWLKRSYLQSRYPRPGNYHVPSENYTKADADRALKLAEETLKWASDVEDLPDPGLIRRNATGVSEVQAAEDIRKRRWADMVGTSGSATDAEKNSARAHAPEWVVQGFSRQQAGLAGEGIKVPGKLVMPPPKAKGPGPGQQGPMPAGVPQVFGAHLGADPTSAPAAKAASGVGAAGAAAAASASSSAAPAGAPVNRWNRHKAATGASTSAAPAAASPASPAAGAASPTAAAAAPAAPASPPAAAGGATKRPAYEDRVADLKEKLKQRRLGKAAGAK